MGTEGPRACDVCSTTPTKSNACGPMRRGIVEAEYSAWLDARFHRNSARMAAPSNATILHLAGLNEQGEREREMGQRSLGTTGCFVRRWSRAIAGLETLVTLVRLVAS